MLALIFGVLFEVGILEIEANEILDIELGGYCELLI